MTLSSSRAGRVLFRAPIHIAYCLAPVRVLLESCNGADGRLARFAAGRHQAWLARDGRRRRSGADAPKHRSFAQAKLVNADILFFFLNKSLSFEERAGTRVLKFYKEKSTIRTCSTYVSFDHFVVSTSAWH
jgi:hypothetical protein